MNSLQEALFNVLNDFFDLAQDPFMDMWPDIEALLAKHGMRAVETSIPERQDMNPVWEMLNRIYDGDVPTVAPDRTMWHYVTVEQNWTVRQYENGKTWDRTVHSTREYVDNLVRRTEREGLEIFVVEEW